MTSRPVVHGSFTIERTYAAPVARVWAAWCDIETKARWFLGPPDRWTQRRRELDFRVGGHEVLEGSFVGGRISRFTARYHAIVPNERIVYAYDMHVDGSHLSVSLASIELTSTSRGGTRMTFTEQAVFLDGEDGTRSREEGTAAHFDRLGAILEDPHEIVSTRTFDAPRDVVFRAFSDPQTLAQWWGPRDHTNTFQEFDLRPGGDWRFTMRAPSGAEFALRKQFVDVLAPERIVLLQPEPPQHRFRMEMTFLDVEGRTHLVWRMRFDSAEEAERIRAFVADANEQNFDRLAAVLANPDRHR